MTPDTETGRHVGDPSRLNDLTHGPKSVGPGPGQPSIGPIPVGIERFRLGGGSSPAVLATFTVRLGRTLRIHGVRLMQGRQGGEWVGWPGRKDPDTGQWSDLFEVPEAISTAVRDQATAAYDAAVPAPQAVPQRDDLDDLPF